MLADDEMTLSDRRKYLKKMWPLATYLRHFDCFLRDARTRTTFTQTVKGIIAAPSPILATGHDGAQRILRMATDESTRRSQVEAAQLTAKLRERGRAARDRASG